MPPGDLAYLTVSELGALYRKRALSPVEVTEACLSRIEAHDDKLNAFITVTADQARAAAKRAEEELRSGTDRGAIHGVPVAMKDLIEIEGIRMTAGSKILEQNVSRVTATVARRLEEGGAVLLGKTNLQEFARGPTGVDSHFGSSSNPWDVTRIAGGSSSGSGAAVAGGMAPAALGSDTGGSVRIPAALCGIVGIRPTYGRVSRYGAVPLGPSYDSIGPMTRTVEDAALMLAVIAGLDSMDPSTRDVLVPDYAEYLAECRGGDLKGTRMGIPRDFFFPGFDMEVEDIVRDAVGVLEGLGAEVREIDIPFAEFSSAAYLSVNGPDSGLYHLPYLRANREDYMTLTAEFFELGLFVPGWRHRQGQAARRLFLRQTAELFREVDVILTPTGPVVATPIKESNDWRPFLLCTMPFSSVGVPALSVPCGFTGAGMPVGMQLVGKWWEETNLFRIGGIYESAVDWGSRRPDFENASPPDHHVHLQALRSDGRTDGEKPTLSRETVREWAAALDLPVSDDALDGLTARVHHMFRSLAKLDQLSLENEEPGAYFIVPGPDEDSA